MQKKQGLELAIQAFELEPSQTTILEIMYAGQRFAELKPRVEVFCENYFNDFIENKDTYVKENGYFHRIVAALNAGNHLRALAKKQNNTKRMNFYNTKMKECKSEQKRLLKRKRW